MVIGWDSSPDLRHYCNAPAEQRILFAEDDSDLRNLIISALHREGFHVLAASSGRELLHIFSAAARAIVPLPRAVVMDIRMPGHSGIELLRALRLAEWTMPVILMTGFGDDQTRKLVLEFGAFALLDKPVPARKLIHVLREAIAQDGKPAEPSPGAGEAVSSQAESKE